MRLEPKKILILFFTSAILTYAISLVQTLLTGSWANGEADGLPLAFSRSPGLIGMGGEERINAAFFFVDTIFWFFIIVVTGKIIKALKAKH